MVNSTNISGNNAGPNSTTVATLQAQMGPHNSTATFNRKITATLTVGPLNDLGSTLLGANYGSGYSNLLVLTAATNSGNGTTINSVDASNAEDGFTALFQNPSSTDPLIFTHLGGGILSNQFTNQNGGSVQIPPLGAARATRINNLWQFA
jgi:hypothetical protein